MTTPKLAENVRGKGRHYKNPDTGVLLPSITNVLGVINKPALPRWSAKLVAEQAAAMKLSLPKMEDDEIVDVLKGAPWRSSTRAADRGTDIHAYLEDRMLGRDPKEISGQAARYRKAADAWLDEFAPEVLSTEQTVFGDGYAGTGDLWCEVDGRTWVLDFKTSKAIYAEASLQLAALWAATHWVGDDGVVRDAPATHFAGVVRIGEDGWEMKQVYDLEGCYRTFRSCLDLWHWQNTTPYGENNEPAV
jgi:hypothetical protein